MANRTYKQQGKEEKISVPVQVGQELVITMVGLNHEAEGVGYVDGYTLFVAGALPSEVVRVQVTYVKKQYGYAKLLDVMEASDARVEPSCPIYETCGGCQLQHLAYAEQLDVKRQQVVNSLERIGKLRDVVVHPTIGMSHPWRYRNKAQVPIGEREGTLIGGFYSRGTHDIMDMEACVIQHEVNDRMVATVKRVAHELGISAYREHTGQGVLRHVVVKVGFASGQVMVVLVTNTRELPHAQQLVEAIRAAIPEVRSICHNINAKVTNVIFGEETRVVWGSAEIEDTIGGIRFNISARSFYQVNPVQTEVLYRQALDYAALTGSETVIDAYCGIGTISLFLAPHAKQVYGVEIVEDAISDAKRNAALNGIGNAQFEAGAAEHVLPKWQRQGIAPDVIVVDPPRKGCDAQLLQTMLALAPARIVYVSCNPATLARDLRMLEDGGYRIVEVQPVDMFPQTVHVEVVCRLVRK